MRARRGEMKDEEERLHWVIDGVKSETKAMMMMNFARKTLSVAVDWLTVERGIGFR